MPVPSEIDLIHVWTQAQSLPPAARAAAILHAASPGEPLDALARLPVGRRDARLLATRIEWFGGELSLIAPCPACGTRVEWQLSAFPLAALEAGEGSLAIASGGYEIEARFPDSFDLIAAANERDPESVRARLIRGCVTRAMRQDEPVEMADLPESVIQDLAHEMSRRDPAGDITFGLTCPECAQEWESLFDIASLFWREVDAAAIRTLRDVHTLATAYGWGEAEVLAIPSERRQLYLAMVTA